VDEIRIQVREMAFTSYDGIKHVAHAQAGELIDKVFKLARPGRRMVVLDFSGVQVASAAFILHLLGGVARDLIKGCVVLENMPSVIGEDAMRRVSASK